MSHDTPQSGRPLTEEDVALLKRGDLLRHERGVFPFRRARDCGDVVVDAPVLTPYDRPGAFTFIGRPDADGWIAWSGGDNPVPGVRVTIRTQAGDEFTSLSDNFGWGPRTDIIAFRLPTAEADRRAEGVSERAVMVCPQCEGEGHYADGVDEAACSTECTRCGSNGWIVDLEALSTRPADADKGVDAGLKVIGFIQPYLIWKMHEKGDTKATIYREGSTTGEGSTTALVTLASAAAALEAAAVRERELRAEASKLAVMVHSQARRRMAAEARAADLLKALERAKKVLDNTAISNALRLVGAYDIISAAAQQQDAGKGVGE